MSTRELWGKAEEDTKEAMHILTFCNKDIENTRRVLVLVRSANTALQALECILAGNPQPKVG